MDTTTLNQRNPDRPVEAPVIWDVEEVARYYRVSTRTVERMNLPYAKIGRRRVYLRDDVVNHLIAKVS